MTTINLDLLYKILNLDTSAKKAEIKKAYRKLSKEHHPDQGGDSETFKKIKEAYEILIDEEKVKAIKEGKNPDNVKSVDGKIKDIILNLFWKCVNNRFVADYEDLIVKMNQECNEEILKARTFLEHTRNQINMYEAIVKRIKKGDILISALNQEIEMYKEKLEEANKSINLLNHASDLIDTYEYESDTDDEIVGALSYESQYTR